MACDDDASLRLVEKEKDDDGGEQMEEKVRASERATSNYSSPAESAKKMQSRRGIYQFHYWLGM